MLQQYLELKRQVEDALLLYRLGDFYELFFEDAELAAPILGIVLTKRRHNEEVSSPMCGIPHHAVASYVGKLLDAGLKVAIAEQVEDPAKAGGLVRRAVIRVLTPGTVTEPELLGDGERRWIAALCDVGSEVAVAAVHLDGAAAEVTLWSESARQVSMKVTFTGTVATAPPPVRRTAANTTMATMTTRTTRSTILTLPNIRPRPSITRLKDAFLCRTLSLRQFREFYRNMLGFAFMVPLG